MKIVDCFWEKRNLGCNTVEIAIEPHDYYNDEFFLQFSNFDYVVVKVPLNKLDFNYGLSSLSYTMIELQMEMSIKLKDFNSDNKYLQLLSSDLDMQEINSKDDLNDLLCRINPGMFSTDRISLDPHFGPVIGCQRYINWIKDEFEKESASIIKLIYKGQDVGFSMFKTGDVVRGLLGGIYLDQQNIGLGLLTPCHLPLYFKRKNMQVKKIVGNISSNNKPVWDLYEMFGYKVLSSRYIFVKHNK